MTSPEFLGFIDAFGCLGQDLWLLNTAILAGGTIRDDSKSPSLALQISAFRQLASRLRLPQLLEGPSPSRRPAKQSSRQLQDLACMSFASLNCACVGPPRTSRSGQPALISWQSTLPKRYLRALTAASAHSARSTAARSTSSRRPSSRGAARIGGVGDNHWRRHERNGNIENKGSRSIWNSPAGQPVQDLAGRVSCSASDCRRGGTLGGSPS